jgi:hypothetical protein
VRIVLIDPSLSERDGRIVPELAAAGMDSLIVKGVPTDVPDDIGARMLEQSDVWADADSEEN